MKVWLLLWSVGPPSRDYRGGDGARITISRPALILISGTAQHSFIIPKLFDVLVNRDKPAAASIARFYLRTIRDAHCAPNDSALRSAKSIRIDLLLELMEAIDRTADEGHIFASCIDEDGTYHWGFFEDSGSQYP